jgi:hypothetical protein
VQFAQSVANYNAVLGNRTFGLTLDSAATQLQALRQLADKADQSLPLHLTPRLFHNDKTGLHAARRLEGFAAQLARYYDLAPVATQSIHDEEAVTPDRRVALWELERVATQLGANLRSPAELHKFGNRLQSEGERLDGALHAIEECCSQNSIQFDGSRTGLTTLRELARVVTDAPEQLLHLQSPGLIRSHQAIEALAQLQCEWTELAAELDNVLYLDALPGEAALKQAVLTLREGNAWYRTFQGRRRAAVAIHRSLQRDKRRVPAQERLGQLERTIALLQLKERWRTDPAWLQYIGRTAPAEPIALDGHVALAAWNRSVKLVLEHVGTVVFARSLATSVHLRPTKPAAVSISFGSSASSASHADRAVERWAAKAPKERRSARACSDGFGYYFNY